MRRAKLPLLVALVAIAAGSSLHSQEVHWTASVSPAAVTPTSPLTLRAPNAVPKDGKAVLTITCTGGADCNSVTAALLSGGATVPNDLTASQKDETSAVFEIRGAEIMESGGATVLNLGVGGKPVGTFTLHHQDGSTPDPATVVRSGAGGAALLPALLARDCRPFDIVEDFEYEPGEDRAAFYVTPLGNVLGRTAPVIDEDDSVTVTVIADPRLVPLLKVYRKSAIRTIGSVRFVGEGTNFQQFLQLSRDSAMRAAAPACEHVSYTLHDFASGKGEVEIRALTGKSGADEATEVIGSFDFNVNPLYSGAFSLGAMRTELSSPEFGLNVNGADTTLTLRSNGSYRVKYVLMYTHFIWGKRDVEKLPSNFIERINPSIGVVLDDITDNFVGGLTADLFEGVYLSGGAHFGRAKELDPKSGLDVGGAYSGSKDDIPTLERWRVKPFFSVGVDVRAAAELLRMALTGSGGGG